MLLIPVILWINWNFLAPHIPNPFAPLLFISYPVADSDPSSPRFAKGPLVRFFFFFFSQRTVAYSLVAALLGCPIRRLLRYRVVIRPTISDDTYSPPSRN